MKKVLFVSMIAAMVLFAASPLFAQGKMMFGVKGGLNLANLTGSDVENTSIKPGAAVGAFMCYKFTDIFAVQPEVLFIMKGAKEDSADVSIKWKANYIEIPLLLKVSMPTEGKIKPSLYVGPGIGILLSSKVSDGEEVDLKDYTKSSNISLIAGAAVAYQLEKGAVSLEARYDVGLQTIAKNGPDDTGTEPDIKTSDISIMVGYAFAF
jgi:hypothetical protein